MNRYVSRSINDAGYARTIAGNLIVDRSRAAIRRYRHYLQLLKVKGNASAIYTARKNNEFLRCSSPPISGSRIVGG